ncbi:MAG: glucokinase [Chloroflexi bacterium]|nr:glucokinase [Chloroflexota bacterium]
MLLAGDIGATKTRLAILADGSDPHNPTAEKTYPSADYPSLEAIIHEFTEETGAVCTRATFGVAGPVIGGRAKITNLPWIMTESALGEELSIEHVRLLNDLEATAYGVLALNEDEKRILNAGSPEPEGTIAVIAPGTGLGEAFLTWNGTTYDAHPSEGGHADFAPLNRTQAELLFYLMERIGHVSYERVCSGMGIPNIYEFLRDEGHEHEPDWLADELARVEDRTPVIANAAFEHEQPVPLALETMTMFVSILGAEASNLALKVLSTGGVYLAGGIPPRILPALEHGFMSTFLNKGRFNDLLQAVPVAVVMNPRAALLGAAKHVIDGR